MDVCTIVARNYVPAARVLARSFRAHHPDSTCWALVIDDVGHEVDGTAEPFEVVRPEHLGIEPWDEMAAGYDVLELSTAVKPWLLRHLLGARGSARVTYLDPDIRVYAPLTEVQERLHDHALVLNPHLTIEMPRDGRRPTETEILSSGAFNLGFAGFAARPETEALLDWWAQRLATDCLVDPERGLFVDQRWMDFAPGLVPSLYLLRDPGCNLAYWNLAGREVTRGADGVRVDGVPLRFFHFSGYYPDRPDQLSRHQDRFELSALPVVRELCDDYGRALITDGLREWRGRPYAFASLADGTPLTRAGRRGYRGAFAAGALPRGSVFSPEGTEALLAYLRGPAAIGGDRGVTRYLHSLWESRADLRETFPDLAGRDGARMAAWSRVARDEVPPSLAEPSGAGTPPGVRVTGYLSGITGVGEHGRQLASALRTAGLPVTTISVTPDVAPEDPSLGPDPETRGTEPESPFNLLCVNADSVPAVAATLGPDFFTGRHTIGFWAWEVSAFPTQFTDAFAYVDEVWVGSRHVRDAVAPQSTVPVLVIPQPVSLSDGAQSAPAPAGLPGGFRFLFAFDYLSIFERKNPLATVEAFTRAFAPGSGATLLIKTLNDDYDPSAHARLVAAAAAHPDVHLLTDRLSAAQRDGLLNAADCYVSLHRAEGFGYTLAEAMWAGKPVIATGYSGNLDYMTATNSYLVDHSLVPVGPGHDPYPPQAVWAEPAVDHAARLMREVFDERDESAARARRAAADIRSSHGPQAAGEAMAARLKLLLELPAWRSPRRLDARPVPLHTDWVEGLIASGPVPPRGGERRLGGAQAAARRGLLRILKPVTVHERLVDGELLEAIETLDAGLRSLADVNAATQRRLEELQGEVSRLRARDDARADSTSDA